MNKNNNGVKLPAEGHLEIDGIKVRFAIINQGASTSPLNYRAQKRAKGGVCNSVKLKVVCPEISAARISGPEYNRSVVISVDPLVQTVTEIRKKAEEELAKLLKVNFKAKINLVN